MVKSIKSYANRPKDNVKEHLFIMEIIEISMKNGLIFCPFCDAANESKFDLAEHIEEFHNKKFNIDTIILSIRKTL